MIRFIVIRLVNMGSIIRFPVQFFSAYLCDVKAMAGNCYGLGILSCSIDNVMHID
ncbi:hypothetical protein [Bartonella sp. CB175]|uniref:hypothetical protein n=1 Tax=Bartonella sp. CB175 TaxID=3112256 RepID=UPI00300DCDFB